MEVKQAIKSLKNIVEYWQCRPTEREAAETAIAALEKQMPKKVKGKNGWLECPTCGACLNKEYGYGKYCEDCGQRLED